MHVTDNTSYYVNCKYGPQWHHVKVLRGRNPWTKQLVLSWSRIPQARIRDTWALLGSHICINAGHLQSNGPQALVWTSGRESGHQRHQNAIRWSTNTAPTLWCREIPKIWKNFINLNEFWWDNLHDLNDLDTSVQPVRVDQWSMAQLEELGGFWFYAKINWNKPENRK